MTKLLLLLLVMNENRVPGDMPKTLPMNPKEIIRQTYENQMAIPILHGNPFLPTHLEVLLVPGAGMDPIGARTDINQRTAIGPMFCWK